MFNLYNGKKFIATFERLKDARAYVTSVLFGEFSRKGFDLVAVNFPRHGDPYKYTFGKKGVYVVVYKNKILKKLKYN